MCEKLIQGRVLCRRGLELTFDSRWRPPSSIRKLCLCGLMTVRDGLEWSAGRPVLANSRLGLCWSAWRRGLALLVSLRRYDVTLSRRRIPPRAQPRETGGVHARG